MKPVSYIGIDSRTDIQTTEDKLAVFPIGATVSMSVNFYDNIGDKFHSTNAVLHHRLNRFDLLQLQSGPDNGTFVARAAHAGSTVLKVCVIISFMPYIDTNLKQAQGILQPL